MKRIGKLYNAIQLIAHKNRRGVLKDDQIRTALEQACAEVYEELLGKYHTERVMPFPLRAFRGSNTVTFTGGVSDAVVTNLYELTGFEVNGHKAEEVYTDEEWTDLKTSDIVAPTVRNPVVKLDGDPISGFNIMVLPDTIASGTAYYLEMPTSWFTLSTTAGARGTTYDDVGSIDILFGETELRSILAKALPYLGLPLQNEAMVELGQLKEGNSESYPYMPYGAVTKKK